MLAGVLLQKYEYLYPYTARSRSSAIWVSASPKTRSAVGLSRYAVLLRALYEELKWQVLRADYIQVDETTVNVIDKEKRQSDR